MYDQYETNEYFQENCAKAEEMLQEPDKVEKLLNKMKKKLERLPFGRDQLAILPNMAMMVHSFIQKQYTKAPVGSIIAIIAAISYFVLPIDVIPDFIPVVGFLDDIGLVALVLNQVNKELNEYMDWRYENGLEEA